LRFVENYATLVLVLAEAGLLFQFIYEFCCLVQ